jgi:peptidoglycan/LPS O-acetylase OafA/YrhL
MNRRERSRYRPELDGLRGVAILAVMAIHSGLFFPRPRLDGLARGVDLFFVLSGFLITSLLVAERESYGRISRRRFYARRALRILPALALALVLADLVAKSIGANIAAAYPRSALIALGFSTNFLQTKVSMLLGHTWSLAIEEQYYLVWPLVLAVLLRKRVRLEMAAVGVLAAAAGVAAMRAVYYHALGGTGAWSGLNESGGMHAMFAWSRGDGVLLGSALALLLSSKYGHAVKDALRDRALVAAAIVGAVAIVARTALRDPAAYDSILLLDICFALVIGHVVSDSTSFVSRALRFPALRGIGKISYGLYLYHLPLFFLTRGLYPPLTAAAISWGAAFGLAITSFYVVERPILGLKRRLSAPVPAVALGTTSLADARPNRMPKPAITRRTVRVPAAA